MSEIDLTSPEVKQAIADAVAEEVKGLKAKNAELIDANKKLRKGQEIDPADLERAENERDQYKQQLNDANKALKKANTDVEAANKRADAAEGFGTKLLVENGLNEALAKAGVTNPVHQKAAKAMLGGQVQIVADGDSRVAKVGDKALADFVTEWAGSDEGKHFVTAADVSGGGAQGASRASSAPSKRTEMNHAQKADYIRKHGQDAYNSLPE